MTITPFTQVSRPHVPIRRRLRKSKSPLVEPDKKGLALKRPTGLLRYDDDDH